MPRLEMKQRQIFLCFILFFIEFVLCKIHIKYNPGCQPHVCNSSQVNVIYVRADVQNTTLHYIWSTINTSPPTLLFLQTPPTSTLKVDWPRLLSTNVSVVRGSVALEGAVSSAAIVFNELKEYNDTLDTADPNDPKIIRTIPLGALQWKFDVVDDQVVMTGRSNTIHPTFTTNSTFTIKFHPEATDGQQPTSPHMFYNPLSSIVDVTIDGVVPSAPTSRFLVSMIVMNHLTPPSDPTPPVVSTTRWTIDDEHAPSVFTTTQLLWKLTNQSQALVQQYWQWRTVCYTSENRNHIHSTDTQTTKLASFNRTKGWYMLFLWFIYDIYVVSMVYIISMLDLITIPVLSGYFDEVSTKSLKPESFSILFGKSGDGFYNKSKYISWSSLVGFGAPPSDEFSITIISVLIVGVGLPIVVLLLGGVYMGVRRVRGVTGGKRGYERIK
ncbi:LOW QUALITY PROTEIN: glycosylated lysosomal membrane protein A-like [Ciona intestinalis]